MEKILVANRGEIALRIMRSLREMDISTVAVYSVADRNARFVKYADEAVCIGEAPSDQSYLKGNTIVDVCKKLNVDGVHPGYGFLSENAEFARLLSKNNIKLLGPSPEAMEIMGSKLAAKAAVKQYDIPMVPGTEGAVDDPIEGQKIAEDIGYPILIKASAGGGGKGMRVVHSSEEFSEQMQRAISEAESAFGDGSVFIERFVQSPRHIEIQVIADQHGNIFHLFERECSIQRRHQKVIEEAPSSVLSQELREEMGKCAVDVARACNYEGVGTVEFLLDEKKRFYFLEMNTRLQVEHPVTELITGIDLVKEQVRVARGEKLNWKQEDIIMKGHALEVRVYAEDPENGFLPDIGKLVKYELPQGPGIRVDDGYEEGMDIPIYYDPMISKLIVYADNRNDACDRMIRAIDEYKIIGVKTTLSFCRFAINHESFRSGDFDTNFVDLHFKPEVLNNTSEDEEMIAALIAVLNMSNKKKTNQAKIQSLENASGWKSRAQKN